ncbi:Uncharacterized protein TPAR_02272, partial [Tolypocladium paradoxum]
LTLPLPLPRPLASSPVLQLTRPWSPCHGLPVLPQPMYLDVTRERPTRCSSLPNLESWRLYLLDVLTVSALLAPPRLLRARPSQPTCEAGWNGIETASAASPAQVQGTGREEQTANKQKRLGLVGKLEDLSRALRGLIASQRLKAPSDIPSRRTTRQDVKSSNTTAANMCVWVSSEYYTMCGCTIEHSTHHPTCHCTTVLPQGVQTWEGYCGRAQCPNPKKHKPDDVKRASIDGVDGTHYRRPHGKGCGDPALHCAAPYGLMTE